LRDNEVAYKGDKEVGNKYGMLDQENQNGHVNQSKCKHCEGGIREVGNGNNNSIPKKTMRIESRITVKAMNCCFENVTKLCLSVRVVENRYHTKDCDNDDDAVFDEPRSFWIQWLKPTAWNIR